MKRRNDSTVTDNDKTNIKVAAIAALVLLVWWLFWPKTVEDVGDPTPETATAAATPAAIPAFNPLKAPTFKVEAKGAGLSTDEAARFAARSPLTLKLFRAMAESGHPYMLEAVKNAKVMKIAFAIQQPPADLGGQLEAEA